MSDEEQYINNRQPGWREENELEKQKAESSFAAPAGSPMKWESVALWPESVCLGVTPNESVDSHEGREAAEAVCDRLQDEGLGGERKIFPISVRVRPVYQENND